MDRRNVRKATPIVLMLFGAASTGTILASDSCGISLVQRMTDATRHAKEHIGPAHKHTQATLTKWEIWGNDYLARHGHAYVPPKRRVVATQPPEQESRIFEFLCDLPAVPELAVWSDGLLDPGLAPLIEPSVDEVAENRIPPIVIPALPVPNTYYGTPVLLVPIGGVGGGFPPAPPAMPPGTGTNPNSPTVPATPVVPGTPIVPGTPVATTPGAGHSHVAGDGRGGGIRAATETAGAVRNRLAGSLFQREARRACGAEPVPGMRTASCF